MATEKTRLLDSYTVTIPKHLLVDENENWEPLTFEQLLPFVDDPWWRNLRIGLFLSFCITFIVMLTMSCIISVMESDICHPKLLTKPILASASYLINTNHNIMENNLINKTATIIFDGLSHV